MPVTKDQKHLLSTGVLSLAIWIIPGVQLLVLPLTYFNTLLHEGCHALATLVTGGRVQSMYVFASGAGETTSTGGSVLFVASAGYIGTTIIGGLIILGSRTEAKCRLTLWVLLSLQVILCAAFLRGDLAGFLSALFWSGALVSTAVWLNGNWLIFVTQFLGLQMCLTSLHSFFTLIVLSRSPTATTDALILQNLTGVPAMAWAIFWSVCSIVTVVLCLARAWRSKSKPPFATRDQLW